MLEPDKSPKARFIYFISCANTVLNSPKEIIKNIFPDNNYCIIDYYERKNDFREISIEVEIDGAKLVCHFDENDRCNVCLIYPDNKEDMKVYLDVCNSLFEYNATTGLWLMFSSYVKYNENEEDNYFTFFSLEKSADSQII